MYHARQDFSRLQYGSLHFSHNIGIRCWSLCFNLSISMYFIAYFTFLHRCKNAGTSSSISPSRKRKSAHTASYIMSLLLHTLHFSHKTDIRYWSQCFNLSISMYFIAYFTFLHRCKNAGTSSSISPSRKRKSAHTASYIMSLLLHTLHFSHKTGIRYWSQCFNLSTSMYFIAYFTFLHRCKNAEIQMRWRRFTVP